MRETLLWQLCVAFLTLSYLADAASPLQVMSAPNVLRVGSQENIFVECQDCTGPGDQVIEINVKDYPANSRLLTTATVTINSGNNFQAFGHITIPSDKFKKDPNMKQYVYLQAQFPGRLLEKVVMVSFQSGYIFIQTDKTIYTPGPNSRVMFRMFAVNTGMLPIERDAADANSIADSISIEIMTPDGIVLPVETVALKSGLHSGNYEIPEIVSPGVWKVVARFQNNPQETYSADFEVKEYVLPSFEVKLTPGSSFFYVDSNQLDIDIRATYLFGKEVDGVAYVVFGVVHEGQKKSFPESLQKVPVVRGEGKAILLRRHITAAFPDIEKNLTKSDIFVSVSVLTESGSEMVEAQLGGIQIVTSPYTFNFKMTPKYFKPGMSFDVSVVVLNPDGSPAVGVPVLVGPGDSRGLTGGNGMAKVTVNTRVGAPQLEITAKTTDVNIRDDRQAYAKYSALPYISGSNSYLHIGVDSTELELGDNMKINLNIPSQAAPKQDITYLVVSRGQLIKAERFKREGQTLVSLSLVITKLMLPSFRIIAYYHIGTNEVVSDSIWVDVKDTCMGSLKLESVQKVPSFEPRKRFRLKVTGDPGATVGLVAVDKGIYVLNNKHRLTQKKVWDLVEKYDTGCTAGGGKNSMGVFYDAGLMFETNTAAGTPYRQAGRYPDKLLYRCCVDGMKDTPLSYDCQRRSEYISDGAACTEAFLYCCTELTSQRADRKDMELHLARSEEDEDNYMDSNDIVTRTHFPESWLWNDVKLPQCDLKNSHCLTTSFERNEPLPDSITTWKVTGISLSKTHGICVADSLDIVVHKPFFIDLRLPYSAVRGEQLEIKAILHNNSPDEATVRVELIDTSEHLCSAASKRGKYRQEVRMGEYTTRMVPFIIIPMKDGHHPIEVKAQIKNSYLSDGIRKLLRVVPEGELIKEPKHIILDPAKHNGKQQIVINSGIPMAEVVVNAPSSTQVTLTGGQQTGAFVENAISGDSMGSLIRQPAGCGEQNMISMTSPVIATTYLDKTNKWENVGFEKRNEALLHIRKGYENQLAYRKKDGCFSVFVHSPCSTWLTSYVLKVFAMTSKLQVAVQDHVICDAVKWLILNTQAPDGIFREIGYAVHYEMRGDVHGTDSDASMTAFVLIAMQEARDVCHGKVNSMAGSINKAVAYLEKRMPSLTNPYAVAMTSYALANEKDKFTIERKQFLYSFVSDLNHWPVPRGHIYSLEATAYALLALVKAQAFEDASPVVKWFNKQRKYGGGFGSTQATMIVYQAVAEYWVSANEIEYDLDVDILIPGRAKPDSFNLNHENFYTTRTSKIKDVNHDLQVTATGRGEATLTVVSLYYALPKERKSDCQKFNLSVELIPEKTVGDLKTYKLSILVLYKDTVADSGMAILDIGLLTGFTVNTKDLDLLIDGVDKVISKYEMNTVLSERGSLIIYLNKVSRKRPDEFAFRVTQTMEVGLMQPAAVSVYEYYDEKKCVKFYHPERNEGALLKLCKKPNDAECTCAEESCSMQKKGNINNDERSAKACETEVDSRIDYVYKARLEQFEDAISTDIYYMRIEEVIKIGTDMGAQGQLRAFLGFQHCRDSVRLTKDRTYLIMGTSKDMFKNEDPNDPGYQYVLGERTWVEYWPTPIECQGDEHNAVCLGMLKLVDYLTIHGCPQ